MHRSRLTPIVLGLAWIFSLGVVFFLGIVSSLAFHLAPGADGAAGLTPAEREAGAVFEQLVGAPLDWTALRSFNPHDRHPPQLDALWAALGAVEPAAERAVLTRRFFRVLGPIKTGALVEHLAPEAARAPVRYGALWQAWHDRDPGTAEAFRAALTASGELPEAVFAPAGTPAPAQ